MVLLYIKYSAKAFNKAVFLLSFTAAVSLLISGLILSLPNWLGHIILLALLLLIKGWLVPLVKYFKTAQHLIYLKCRVNTILKISK